MDVNFKKYSNVSFVTFVFTVFISSKNHIQVLNRSSKTGTVLVKTITSLEIYSTFRRFLYNYIIDFLFNIYLFIYKLETFIHRT